MGQSTGITMDPYKQFDIDLASCKACESILRTCKVDPCVSDKIVVPRPIVTGIKPKPLMVIGQAPGLSEYRSGLPYQGKAGQGIRRILAELGVSDFDEMVFSSAIVKCFPGRKHRKKNDPASKCEELPPSSIMIRNCRPFLERGIKLADPSVIVTLGLVALKAYLQLSGQRTPSKLKLFDGFVGMSQEWNGRTVVFFAHPSPRARWRNDPTSVKLFDQAKALLGSILRTKGLGNP